jgi:hypothetical protein
MLADDTEVFVEAPNHDLLFGEFPDRNDQVVHGRTSMVPVGTAGQFSLDLERAAARLLVQLQPSKSSEQGSEQLFISAPVDARCITSSTTGTQVTIWSRSIRSASFSAMSGLDFLFAQAQIEVSARYNGTLALRRSRAGTPQFDQVVRHDDIETSLAHKCRGTTKSGLPIHLTCARRHVGPSLGAADR